MDEQFGLKATSSEMKSDFDRQQEAEATLGMSALDDEPDLDSSGAVATLERPKPEIKSIPFSATVTERPTETNTYDRAVIDDIENTVRLINQYAMEKNPQTRNEIFDIDDGKYVKTQELKENLGELEKYMHERSGMGLLVVEDMVRSWDDGLKRIGLRFLTSQLDELSHNESIYGDALLLMTNYGDAEQYGIALDRTKTLLRSQFEKGDRHHINSSLLNVALRMTTEQDQEEFEELYLTNWREDTDELSRRFNAKILSDMIVNNQWGSDQRAFSLLERRLGVSLVDARKLAEDWKQGDKPKDLKDSVTRNIEMMMDIEDENEGSVEILNRDFGISDFSRYPREVLSNQVKEKDDLDSRYGIIAYPRNDHNGAFYQDRNRFSSLKEQLDTIYQETGIKYNIRVIEVASKVDMAKKLIRLDRKYNKDGEGNQISFGIFGGHGERDRIQFGKYGDIGALITKDLYGEGVKKAIGRFFSKKFSGLLHSCSTGTRHGIGERLSYQFKTQGSKEDRINRNAEFTAPDIPSTPDEIFVTIDDEGNLHLSETYTSKPEDGHVKSMHYQNGREILN